MPKMNNDKFDLDGVSYSKRVQSAGREYELEMHELESMKEINLRINKNTYFAASEVRDHLEYLENLLQKVKIIIQSESSAGIVNLSLKRDFNRIQKLYNNLTLVLDRLEAF